MQSHDFMLSNEIWHEASPKRIIRLGGVKIRTGLSKSSIYNKINQGTFPKPVALGPGARAVGWRAADIEAWIDACGEKK